MASCGNFLFTLCHALKRLNHGHYSCLHVNSHLLTERCFFFYINFRSVLLQKSLPNLIIKFRCGNSKGFNWKNLQAGNTLWAVMCMTPESLACVAGCLAAAGRELTCLLSPVPHVCCRLDAQTRCLQHHLCLGAFWLFMELKKLICL